jgi:hypothetical protein
VVPDHAPSRYRTSAIGLPPPPRFSIVARLARRASSLVMEVMITHCVTPMPSVSPRAAECVAAAEDGSFTSSDNAVTFTPVASSSRSSLTSRSALRAQLRSRWVYIHGDSSARGLFLSLYQQLMNEHVDGNLHLNSSYWLGGHNAGTLGYLDVVLSADGEMVAVHSRAMKEMHSMKWLFIPPSDASQELAPHWCLNGSTSQKRRRVPCSSRLPLCQPPHDRIRLTFRGRTLAQFLPADQFSELRHCWLVEAHTASGARTGQRTRPPDVHVLQDGSYDDRALTPRCLYERQLLAGLTVWRAAADAARETLAGTPDGPPSPLHAVTRVFATSVVSPRLTIRHTNLPAKLPHFNPPIRDSELHSTTNVSPNAVHTCTRVCPLASTSPRLRGRECHELMSSKIGSREVYHAGSWERELFQHGLRCAAPFDAAMARAVEGVGLLNHASSGAMLERCLGQRCACLSAKHREALWSASMRYHAPHLHNLWDVLSYDCWSSCGTGRAKAATTRHDRRLRGRSRSSWRSRSSDAAARIGRGGWQPAAPSEWSSNGCGRPCADCRYEV